MLRAALFKAIKQWKQHKCHLMGTELTHWDIILMEYDNIFVLAVCPGKQSLRNGAGNLLRSWFRKLQWKHKDSDTQKEEKSIKCIKELVSSADAWGPFPLEAHEETVWIECQNLSACALSLQSCLNLCNPTDCHPPHYSVHGILQARILEWVAVSFSRGSYWPRDRTWFSCIAGWFFTVWATRVVANGKGQFIPSLKADWYAWTYSLCPQQSGGSQGVAKFKWL